MDKIVVKELKYRYPTSNELALKGISFTLSKGELLGIIGHNGSGKSTLCYALVGIVPYFFKGAFGGKVIIDGEEINERNYNTLYQKVGLVFQNPYNQMTGSKQTVFEEIAFGLENLALERNEIISRVEEVLKLLKIEDLKERNPFELSGGQLQKVAIASILAMKPEILVFDEPTSQLDPESTTEIFQIILELKNAGYTIVLVEHKIEKLCEFSDKLMVLSNGTIKILDTPTNIFNSEVELIDVNEPIVTKICKEKGIKKKDGRYPVTIKELEELVNL